MKKSEILELLKYMHNYYGNRVEIPSIQQKLDMKINTWYDFLSDIDYKVAKTAAQKLMTYKEWPPTPGEIAIESKKLLTPEKDKLTAGEAWGMILRAIRKYGVLYGTKEAEASLPPKALKAANCIGGLRNIGMSDENDTYFMNQFYRVYNNVSNAIDMDERLPEGIKRESAKLAERYKNPQLESGDNS